MDPGKLPNPDCKILDEWEKGLDAEQVTIVFPAAYLNNPSSMFGHLFMRFEPKDESESAFFMAKTINFAAETSAKEGVVDYIFRGLFGGFPCTSSIQPFYLRFKRYSDMESRDIWEYKLNLTREELDRLVRHVWELNNSVFDYYFLDENCAYRIVALLEVARPNLCLAEEFDAYTLPSDVIRGLKEKKSVESTVYKASAMKTFYHHVRSLYASEERIVFDIIQRQLPLDDPRLQALSPERKALVLAVTSEYLALLINRDMLNRDRSAALTQKIFFERINLGLPVRLDNTPAPKFSPDEGHKSHRIRLGGGRNRGDGFLSLAYRGVYHSFQDPLPGFEKGAQVELFNVELRDYEYDGVRLEQLGLINITSLSPFNMFFKPISWRFSLGAERREINSEEALLEYAQGGLGITYDVGGWMLAGLAYIELDVGKNLNNGYGLGSGLLLDMVYQTDNFSIDLGLSSMKYFVGDDDLVTSLWGKLNIPIGRNNAFYTEMEYDPKGESRRYEIGFGISHYF